MPKVFVTTGDHLTEKMFKDRGWQIASKVTDEIDFACFTGGADVNPFLYGERPIPGTHFDVRRDCIEIKYWKYLGAETPKIGICRGSQFGNVMSGGSLWQDVDNHAKGYHVLKDKSDLFDDKWTGFFPVSSTHHQMSRLAKDAILLAAAGIATRLDAEGENKRYGMQPDNRNDYEDVEAFYYDKTNFLGVQFHPEYQEFKRCREYFWDLVDGCFFPAFKEVPTLL